MNGQSKNESPSRNAATHEVQLEGLGFREWGGGACGANSYQCSYTYGKEIALQKQWKMPRGLVAFFVTSEDILSRSRCMKVLACGQGHVH